MENLTQDDPVLEHERTPISSDSDGEACVRDPVDYMKIYYSNLNTFLNKKDEILTLIDNERPDILAFTELLDKKNPELSQAELKLQGYETFYGENPGRGVVLYAREDLNAKRFNNLNSHNFSEHVWCTFKSENGETVLIGNVYRSPSSSDSNYDELLNILKSDIINTFDRVYITGDFNLPDIDWNSTNNSEKDQLFIETLREAFLVQHVDKPTRHMLGQKANILDLVITKTTEDVLSIDHCSHIGKSDHLLLKITTDIRKSKVDNSNDLRFNYTIGNYDAFRCWLSPTDWSVIINMTVEEGWSYIKSIIDEGKELFIPKTSCKQKSRKPKWMNPTVCKSIKKKHLLFKRFLNSNNSYIYKQYIEARNEAARVVKNAKRNHQSNIARECKSNPKKFWKYINNSRKCKTNIAPLTSDKINFVTDDKGKADMLNDFFSSVFTIEDTENLPSMSPGEKSKGFLLSDLRVTRESVQRKLATLNPFKSPGPDMVVPKLLKELSSELAVPLTILFNLSLERGEVPSEWKHAQVSPIFKKGDKSSPNNYRPVSLTCIVCKILESFIRDSVQDHMESLGLFSDCQHGFRSGRSCTTQLLEVMNDFTSFYDDNLPFDVIYLDFKKAFDTVPHFRLINKLRGYGIDGNILKWIDSFLSNRTQQVKINNEFSNVSNVTSGIPQGSVLGPVLFTIFINDLPEHVNSLCKIFADDTKIYNICENFKILQGDLEALQFWSEKWQLFFNIDKCVCLHFGRKNPKVDYTITCKGRSQALQESNEEKDLGVTFDTKLKFDQHINTVINKANKVLGLIKRNFKCMNKFTLITLYKSLVRPILEYGQPVWAPFLKRQTKLIENVQRRATKLISDIKHLP
ncbi:MAG: hypothetical protein GY694_05770, partial [Gammaproteobacteria bacterium]|nr:hypothetical protein [Gammaproteobacteria bacterium]